MKHTKTLSISGAVLAGAILAVAVPLAASAHVSVKPSDTSAGAYSLLTFSVPHGCEGSPTTSIKITIPEEINGVTPTVNPNWDVTKDMVDLATPIKDAHGNSLAQRVGSVTYTAKTPLADGYRDAMVLQLQLPAEAGKTLTFPTLQTCETGSTNWSEIPAKGQSEEDLKAPAPSLVVTAAAKDAGHGGHDASATDTAAETHATAAEPDVLARGLGIAGLALGVIGIIVGTLGLRAKAARK
ncbi:YcnI family protein [Mycetocola sp. JXN-3]|uniref:YcnI family copper-binding membrane protein n=1 Tax=Mycetocola sp. JXN-3 TaxID=2116510 RepID=UPI00165D1C39|nr:YcnI family protein [Mycetocola sp. JXN-3]